MSYSKEKKTIWEFFIDNYKFTVLLIAAFLLGGFISMLQMTKESQPEIIVPVGVVRTIFPGASAEDVETLVTDVIEDKLASLDDVKKMTSASARGVSNITVEFFANTDVDEKIRDLKDQVDVAALDLPSRVEDPVVQQISFDDEPFFIVGMSGPFDVAQLGNYAETWKDEMESIPGVSSVQIFGDREREMQVIVDKVKLDQFGLSLQEITQAIQTANSDIPVGEIETAGAMYSVRFDGQLKTKEDIEQVPIRALAEEVILISDIATVIDGYAEQAVIVRLSESGNPVQSAVSLRVFKQSGGDIIRLTDEMNKRSAVLMEEAFPKELNIITTLDTAVYIQKDLSSLGRNGLGTVIIVSLLLALFLGWREASMAALSIPLTFLMTFLGLASIGYTINFMTLFSLILSLGILVDSTIVINEHLNKQVQSGLAPLAAAKKSIRELQYPLIAGVLTTVFAFLPMLLASGIMGQFIKTIPVTVTIVLLSSLFAALAIIPSMTVLLLRHRLKKKGLAGAEQKNRFSHTFDRWRGMYRDQLGFLFAEKKARRLMGLGIMLAFLASYSLPAMGALPIELFAQAEQDRFFIEVEEPYGTPLDMTLATLVQVEEILRKDDRIANFITSVGIGSGAGSESSGGTAHLGSIQVNLKDADLRGNEKSYQIVDAYQQKLNAAIETSIEVTQEAYGPGNAAPVEVRVSGDDLAVLDQLAEEIEIMLEEIPGTQNVATSIVTSNGQFVVRMDREEAAYYGMTANNLALTLRTAVNGVDATTIRNAEDDIDVVVRYGLNDDAFVPDAKANRTDISTLSSLTIASQGRDIPLKRFAEIPLEANRTSIDHQDGERIVRISSYVQSGVTPGMIFAALQERITQMDIPEGYMIDMGGQDEDTRQTFEDMFRAMFLAILLIASLLILQFKSYTQAAIIMCTIPLALIGVFPGLLLMNVSLSFPGMIGIVALIGVVVNNAIILIDKINSNREEGLAFEQAIINAGSVRLEPIVLTTLTTVCGILPLALSEPIWAALGYALIYGLIFSTGLTLYVVPLLYRWWFRREA